MCVDALFLVSLHLRLKCGYREDEPTEEEQLEMEMKVQIEVTRCWMGTDAMVPKAGVEGSGLLGGEMSFQCLQGEGDPPDQGSETSSPLGEAW